MLYSFRVILITNKVLNSWRWNILMIQSLLQESRIVILLYSKKFSHFLRINTSFMSNLIKKLKFLWANISVFFWINILQIISRIQISRPLVDNFLNSFMRCKLVLGYLLILRTILFLSLIGFLQLIEFACVLSLLIKYFIVFTFLLERIKSYLCI